MWYIILLVLWFVAETVQVFSLEGYKKTLKITLNVIEKK